MDNINITTAGTSKKTNRILLFGFVGVLIITIALVSVYLYTQHSATKNNKASQNNVSIALYLNAFKNAKVGEPYKFIIGSGVYNQNVQIIGEVVSGLPPGLKMTGCSTEYNSLAIKQNAAVNSLGKCNIEGTPLQSGDFTVRVHFSTQGGGGDIYKDFPLVVNP